MRMLVIGDMHNDVENLMQFLDLASEFKFDMIICPGDFTDIAPRGFSQLEVGRLVLEELKSTGKPVLAVPGNQDDKMIEVFEREGVSIHGRGRVVGGIGFYGFGGAKTPFNTAYEPGEDDIEVGILEAYESVKDIKTRVQVTHNPPYGTRLDVVGSGIHVGSPVVRKLIEQLAPTAAICAHIHEARGVDQIGQTKIINPGRFPEGYAGIVDIDGSNVDMKVVNLI
jgi:uncharacterized protein